ncbi:MAG: hypothetical protein ACYDH4_12685 [Candidatus Cryosericum sp.]
MAEHNTLKQAAFAAVRALFGDTSVSVSVTRDDLVELRDEIEMLMDAAARDRWEDI